MATSKDSRKRSLLARLTEREYGGRDSMNGYRGARRQQDTGRHYGRGRLSRSSSPTKQGPRF